MNQRQFLELLNLYIDGEIPSAQAAELEKEIMLNPKRRRVYDEYCRVHRATKLVYDRFRVAAFQGVEAGRPAPIVSSGIASALPAEQHRNWWSSRWIRILGSGAVAASVAFAFLLGGKREELVMAPAPAVAAEAKPAAPEPSTPETFAAPFAAEVRTDPYVASESGSRPSPFSLTTVQPTQQELTKPDSEPQVAVSNLAKPQVAVSNLTKPQVAVSNLTKPEGQISSPFGIESRLDESQPAIENFPTVDSTDRPGRVFRGSEKTPAAELEPVGYLIHR